MDPFNKIKETKEFIPKNSDREFHFYVTLLQIFYGTCSILESFIFNDNDITVT